ncbi:stage V sporulation protein AE [Sulfobacillus sp. hq2]|uniref:Stage V sporulation protein AE n=1 Tax=Sulfobacillus thermotolerans TaxID=338644 RepID=A0ABM6RQJ2_9FIRM|nr:stage V sporulation protein AE [Sulfobacillus sp. hq2]AUW93630.1 stage V sporulation protein AE [Sulfobacillus thermotolerans]POB10873.1 stage V sporulation protein AE [Sulfobacillus sp. hq2]
MPKKTPIIIVTDGDQTAYHAIEEASAALHLHPLKASRGNPTPLTGQELLEAIAKAPQEPVVVMVDDRGEAGTGRGEEDLEVLMNSDEVEVLGVVAVAANTHPVDGVTIDSSVTKTGKVVKGQAVDKGGNAVKTNVLHGDTVDVLADDVGDVPIIGLGDPGKMGGHDAIGHGVPATRRALEEVLQRSGYHAR